MSLTQLGMILFVILGEPNIFISSIYTVVQLILLSLFYGELIKNRLIYVFAGVLLCFMLVQYAMDPSLFFRYNSIGISLSQALLIGYSLIYFYRSISAKTPFIIVNVGVFIYLICSTLIFASGNLQYELSQQGYLLLLNLNIVFYLLFQCLVTFEWYTNYRTRKATKKLV
ncbi:hypothetical protein [Gilvibacter sp.]|uniref:hypothetical protein n=1 Tax=Gilvibacter sp. TaxID=2729997 RepID=UPI003F4A7F45